MVTGLAYIRPIQAPGQWKRTAPRDPPAAAL